MKADFGEKMAKKREKLLLNGEDRRAEVMTPTGNPFLDLCIWKGRFPSVKARFCTEELKILPVHNFMRSIANEGKSVFNWSGERAEESLARSKKPIKETLFTTPNGGIAYVYRPILRWKEHECFDMLERHGIKPNPLYGQGFNRVGCFPCIMCRKGEIKRINDHYPEVFEKIADWEKIVSKACKRETGSNFYKKAEGKETLERVIEWSKTSRGGKQYPLIFEE